MVKLPDPYGPREAPVSREVITHDDSAGLIGDTVTRSSSQLFQALDEQRQKEDQLAYAQAKADLTVADIDARKELEGDTDFSTFSERYSKSMDAARENALARVKNPTLKRQLEIDAQTQKARGDAMVAGQARQVEVDFRRGEINTSLEALRDNGLSEAGAGPRTIAAANEQIEAAIQAGYYSAEEGKRLREKWVEDFATSKIEMMALPDQVKVLRSKDGLASWIDPDTRKKMLDAAVKDNDAKNKRLKSQEAADLIYQEDRPLKEMLAEARKIKDPEVRDSTVTRVTQRYNETEGIKADTANRSFDVLHGALTEQNVPYGSLMDMAEWDDITPGQKDSLARIASSGAKSTSTNPDTWLYLTRMSPNEFAQVNLKEYSDHLSIADFKDLAGQQDAILNGEDISGTLTNKEIVKESLLIAYPDKKKREKVAAEFSMQVDQQVRALEQQKRRAATGEEVRQITDNLLIKVELKGFNKWGWDRRAFQLQEGDVVTSADIPDAERKQILAVLEQRNLPATDDNILWLYTQKHGLMND